MQRSGGQMSEVTKKVVEIFMATITEFQGTLLTFVILNDQNQIAVNAQNKPINKSI